MFQRFLLLWVRTGAVAALAGRHRLEAAVLRARYSLYRLLRLGRDLDHFRVRRGSFPSRARGRPQTSRPQTGPGDWVSIAGRVRHLLVDVVAPGSFRIASGVRRCW